MGRACTCITLKASESLVGIFRVSLLGHWIAITEVGRHATVLCKCCMTRDVWNQGREGD